jgi:wobble nucleotide-excising tRNase
MDSDKDDLAALCEGMTKDEVDRVHRLLHEWKTGPSGSFPVQLALLTCAQLRAAANVPRTLNDARKWLELHLAEYRQQTAVVVQNFRAASDDKIEMMEGIIQKHVEAMEQIAADSQGRLAETEKAARQIKLELEISVARSKDDLKKIRDDLQDERIRLQQTRRELESRMTWQAWLQILLVLAGCVFLGVLIDRLWIQ